MSGRRQRGAGGFPGGQWSAIEPVSYGVQGIAVGYTNVEFVVISPKPVKEEMPVHLSRQLESAVRNHIYNEETYLRLDQDQINEQHDKVMLDVLVREALATRALRQAHALAKGVVVRLAVRCVEMRDRVRAFDANGHRVILAAWLGSICRNMFSKNARSAELRTPPTWPVRACCRV